MRLPSKQELAGEGFLLAAALLWGFSFVLQRLGMETMAPFGFNALRYSLGALFVLPALALYRSASRDGEGGARKSSLRRSLAIGSGSGIVMFGAASLQQMGIVGTTAGKAGFISGLYIVFVPILSLVLKKRSGPQAWIGALVASAGLYFLSMDGGFSMSRGDFLVLLGSFLWAVQILYLGRFSSGANPFALAASQFAVVAALSFIPAIALEGLAPAHVSATIIPIAASGVFAVGLGFTFQILGQRSAPPGRASLIMSLESPFAAVAGAVFLGEAFTPRMLSGAALMLAGMLLAQAKFNRRG